MVSKAHKNCHATELQVKCRIGVLGIPELLAIFLPYWCIHASPMDAVPSPSFALHAFTCKVSNGFVVSNIFAFANSGNFLVPYTAIFSNIGLRVPRELFSVLLIFWPNGFGPHVVG